jgi:hypothetical protein
MIATLLVTFTIASDAGPLNAALRATEAPKTLRAAFTVELASAEARQVFQFDPHLEAGARWQQVDGRGEDDELDQVAATWGAEAAPDGRLFPDDLRASFSAAVDVTDLGKAWRVGFQHQPSLNDGALDNWATQNMQATAWLDPVEDRFLRLDHALPAPVRGPNGGRVTRYEQTHWLETDPRYGLSFIAAFSVRLQARFGPRQVSRHYTARITQVEFFFASVTAETAFLEQREARTSMAQLR